ALVKDQIFRQLAQPQEIKNAEEQAKRIYDDITKNKKTMADVSKLQLVEMRTTDFFPRQQPPQGLSPAFGDKAFELKNKNDISEPVQVFQDYAIVQLLDTKGSEIEPFEKVQANAIQKYRDSRATELAQQKAQAFYDSIGPTGDLKAAADKAKLTVKTTDAFTKDGFITDLGSAKDISDKVFTMKAGDLGGPVKTDRSVIVFKVLERKEFSQADFEKQKDTLRSGILNQKQSGFLQSYRAMLRKKYEKTIWINQEALNPQKT
ncbi:MAG TPA: peptidyl-prolyl cis-trans isomerase, partial [Acidobacteriota bacterium]|nr:peptidyl-prolyl cis-trans isomerase [Acidobacteriota bacterium]